MDNYLKFAYPNIVNVPVRGDNGFFLDEAVFIRMCTDMFENKTKGQDFRYKDEFQDAWLAYKGSLIEQSNGYASYRRH